jgi:hypothetical protein
MPDRRRHRGAHPDDIMLFERPDQLCRLTRAAGELAWLLARGYTPSSALTLVGNHYQLHQRQRRALAHAVAAPDVARQRRQRHLTPNELVGQRLQIDTLNQVITIEVALAGGLLLCGHDGAWRDLASVHGTYRMMQETPQALAAIGMYLAPLELRQVVFLIDAAVSNSGRLAAQLRTLAVAHDWPWEIDLVPSADPILKATSDIIATSDSAILDRTTRWFDLAAAVGQRIASDAWRLRLDTPPPVVR